MTGSSFVGRRDELEQLSAALDEAVASQGRVLVVGGEPGIGKTRLADELAARAQHQGARVLIGRCYEGEGSPVYWPWIQIVRTYVESTDPDTLGSAMGPGAANIAQVVPAVREHLPDLPMPAHLEPAPARFRLLDSFTTFFKKAATRQPLVVILDDLHWADKPSLLLLQFLAREIGEARVLVVGSYRDGEVRREHPLADSLGELARLPHFRRLLLRGLREEDVGNLIELRTGRTPLPSLVATVHRQSEGNPFFIGEFVQLLLGDRRLESAGSTSSLGVPQGVRDMVGRRLNRLSAECNRLLTLAAVIGRDFSLRALAHVSQLESEQLLAAVEEAVAAHVVAGVAEAPGSYRFSHVLIRDALYEELNAIRRLGLHARVGEALEHLYQANPEPHFAELAHHFFEAAPLGNVDRAVDYAVRAAERATGLLAYEEATPHYERALQALELRESAGDGALRCALLLELGDSQIRSGDWPKARDAFWRAAVIARTLGAPEQLARAALGLGRWEQSERTDELIDLLEETRRALGEEESAVLAKVSARLARALCWKGDIERSAALSHQAVEMARRLAAPDALAHALFARRYLAEAPETLAERLALATQLVELAEEAGDAESAMNGHWLRLVELLELGDVRAVDQEIEVCVRLAEHLRQPFYLQHTATFRAMRAALEGRFDVAEEFAREVLAIGQQVQDQAAILAFSTLMFDRLWEQGRIEEIDAVVRMAVEQYPAVSGFRAGLAQVHSELGREADARREFECLAAHGFVDLRRDFGWLATVTALCDVCAFLGDAARAALLYDLLLPFAGRNVVTHARGSVSRYLGVLAATLSRWDEATRHFEDALRLNGSMRARPSLARTQLAYATMLVARGQRADREEALALVGRALATALDLGMNRLADKASTLENALGGAARVSEASPARDGHGANLWRREGEFWTIAYDGGVFRLKDTIGLRYLAQLLAEPGREFLVTDLVSSVNGSVTHDAVATAPEGLSIRSLLGDGGEHLDARAEASYRTRLAELRDELTEANRLNDAGRGAKAQAELDVLLDELRGGLGLGGRPRRPGSHLERARVTVTKVIRAAIKRVTRHDPGLGHHLAGSIKTGRYCSYAPAPHAAPFQVR